MKIIFCSDPIQQNMPDAVFTDEIAAATHHELAYWSVHDEDLRQGRFARAVRDIPVQSQTERAVYRGWPLSIAEYSGLYDALLSRGLKLIADPVTYLHNQYFPHYYAHIEPMAPRATWLPADHGITAEDILPALDIFDGGPVVMRDYMTMQKRYWYDAAYIPDSRDRVHINRVVTRFIELSGGAIEGGLVFREYLDFATLSDAPNEGTPLIQEVRLFWLHGEVISVVRDWEMSGYDELVDQAPLEPFKPIVAKLRGQFVTMDIARLPDDRWLILEIGDAQVAPLPEMADHEAFYTALKRL